ncbi:MAG TPA: hypothetical protein VND40_02280 [Nitrososphaerales archaeon]|nr:hypothetical protein [Nitrososphaerales archaeon]
MTPVARPQDEARRLLKASSEEGVVLKLIGGVAVAIRCPSASREGLRRSYADLDFVGHEKQSRAIADFFVEMGYRPRARFNAMMGGKRLIFNDLTNERRADVFLDVFEMCHKFNFGERLDLEPLTLPLADLLATKLQIVQINEKDFRDSTTLLLDHDVGPGDGETINGHYLARLCSNDWGAYKTFTMNLERLEASIDIYGLTSPEMETAKARIGRLAEMIEKEPKSLAWKMRARVGERKTWYELPEADEQLVVGSLD